jgi:hypothetical protein
LRIGESYQALTIIKLHYREFTQVRYLVQLAMNFRDFTKDRVCFDKLRDHEVLRKDSGALEVGDSNDGYLNTVTARQKTYIARQQLRERNNTGDVAKQRGYKTKEELLETVFSMRSLSRP